MIETRGIQVFTELAEIVEPRHTALLVIDVQRDFCSPEGVAARRGKDVSMIAAAIPRIRTVVDAARGAGVRPIFIQNVWLPEHRSVSGAWLRFAARDGRVDLATGWTIAGTAGAEIMPEVDPRPGDIVVPKSRSNAFFGTSLDTILRCNGIKSVVCVGFVTEGCLEATARDAVLRDYYAVVLEDCTGAFDPALHQAALTVLRQRVDVVPSSAVLALWSRPGEAGIPRGTGLDGGRVRSCLG